MKRFRFATIAVVTIAGIVAAETALSSMTFRSDSVAIVPDPYLHHVHLRDRTFIAHHPSGEFGGFDLHFDSEGRISSRAPRHAVPGPQGPLSKGGSTCRLALIGDSFMEAAQVPYADSIAGRLEAAGRGRCEVRNYGVRAYGPAVYLVQYTRDIRPWHPTILAVLLYANDMSDDRDYLQRAVMDSAGFPTAIQGPGNGWLETRLRRSSLVRLSRTAGRHLAWIWSNDRGDGHIASGFVEDYPELSGPTADLLVELNRRILSDGAEAVFMAVPSSYKLHGGDVSGKVDFHARAKTFAGTTGLRFLDLYTTFEKATVSGIPLFFKHDVHFNAAGHAVAAAELARAFPVAFGDGSAP